MAFLEIYSIVLMIIAMHLTISRPNFRFIEKTLGSMIFVPVIIYCAVNLVGRF